MISKYISYIAFFFIFINLLSCSEKKLEVTGNLRWTINNKLNIFEKYFYISDSIELKYPVETIPTYISDISHTKEYIYIHGKNTKFPLVKFDLNGNYKNNIDIPTRNENEIANDIRISAKNDWLILVEGKYNRISFYKNNLFYFQKKFGESRQIYDAILVDDNKIIISCLGKSHRHLFLINDRFEIIDSLFTIPEITKVTRFGFYNKYGVQFDGKDFISCLPYPPKIFLFSLKNGIIKQKKIIKGMDFFNFQFIDPEYTYKKYKDDNPDFSDKLAFSQLYSVLKWVMNDKNYYYGIYMHYGKRPVQKALKNFEFSFFVLKGGKKIFENNISGHDFYPLCNVIPDNEKLIFWYPYTDNEKIKIKLYYLKLNIEKINKKYPQNK